MKQSTKKMMIVLAVILVIIVTIILVVNLTGPKEIAFSGNGDTLENLVKNGKIEAISFEGGYKINIKMAGEEKYNYFAHISYRDDVSAALASWSPGHSIVLVYDNPSSSSMAMSFIMPILMLVVMGGLMFVIFKKSSGSSNQIFGFGKTKANQVKDIKVRFNDVAGADEEKQELEEIVDFLKNPKKYTDIGAKIPKGVLLVGPPGTGKTLFARAVAGEANVPFFAISGSDFVEMFVGVGASRVRDLFEQAKKNMPCIIFIDEIDAVGRQRGAGLGGGNDEREQTLNQLLVQMDGFETNSSIIIMAATNRADILDPALLRPGRFDRQIVVNIPDVRGREDIFKVHSRNKPLGSDINFKNVARLTAGFTGADIENLLNEAAILAAREDRKLISMIDISEAINKVIAGPAKRSRLVTPSDKRITAYHEAGHAIVARIMKHCENVHEVSIIPRGMAAGYTITLPVNDDNHMTKGRLLDNIAMLLGGRAAEAIVIKDISTGASSDIQRASGVARKMVTEWGMSDVLGNMYLGSSQEIFLGRDYQSQLSYSDDVAGVIDGEIKKILDEQYTKAYDILMQNRALMDSMVKLLYKKETIYAKDIEALLNGESVEEEAEVENVKSDTPILTAEVKINPIKGEPLVENVNSEATEKKEEIIAPKKVESKAPAKVESNAPKKDDSKEK